MINNPEHYVTGLLNRDGLILAKTITLIESTLPAHQELARTIVDKLLPHTGRSIRVGITGVPGAGKSTYIERFGKMLTGQGHRQLALPPVHRADLHDHLVAAAGAINPPMARH